MDIGRKDMDDVCGGARIDAISWEQRTVRLTWIVFLMMCEHRRKRQRETADRRDGVSLAVATETTPTRIGNDSPVAQDASVGDKGSVGSDNTNGGKAGDKAGNKKEAKVGDIEFDDED